MKILKYISIMAISVNVLFSNEVELEFEDEILLSQQGSAHQKFPEAVSTDDGTLHIIFGKGAWK